MFQLYAIKVNSQSIVLIHCLAKFAVISRVSHYYITYHVLCM